MRADRLIDIRREGFWEAAAALGTAAAEGGGAAGAGAGGASALSAIPAATGGASAVTGMGSGAEALLGGGQLATGSGAAGTTAKSGTDMLGAAGKGLKAGLGGLSEGVDSPAGKAAMQLMQMGAARKPGASPITQPPRSGSGTQPSIQQFLQMLQNQKGPALRLPGMG